MTDRKLIPGRFYWAQPVLDVDAFEAWMNEPQPARYVGNGSQEWEWIGCDGDDWPARWVGAEITMPAE